MQRPKEHRERQGDTEGDTERGKVTQRGTQGGAGGHRGEHRERQGDTEEDTGRWGDDEKQQGSPESTHPTERPRKRHMQRQRHRVVLGIEMESITENSEGLTQTGRERGRGWGEQRGKEREMRDERREEGGN